MIRRNVKRTTVVHRTGTLGGTIGPNVAPVDGLGQFFSVMVVFQLLTGPAPSVSYLLPTPFGGDTVNKVSNYQSSPNLVNPGDVIYLTLTPITILIPDTLNVGILATDPATLVSFTVIGTVVEAE